MAKLTRNQGGSIISFILVTILVVAVLISGVVWLRNRSDMAKSGNLPGDTSQDANSGNSQVSPESEDFAVSESKPETPVSNEENTSGESTASDAAQTDASASVAANESPSQLPETGLGSTVSGFVALGSLTFAAAGYLRSRQRIL